MRQRDHDPEFGQNDDRVIVWQTLTVRGQPIRFRGTMRGAKRLEQLLNKQMDDRGPLRTLPQVG